MTHAVLTHSDALYLDLSVNYLTTITLWFICLFQQFNRFPPQNNAPSALDQMRQARLFHEVQVDWIGCSVTELGYLTSSQI